MENSIFDQGPGAKTKAKKPVKFSDNLKEIMKAERERDMKKMGIVPKAAPYKPAKRAVDENSLSDFIQIAQKPAPKKPVKFIDTAPDYLI